jgi:hypothetical protein
MPKAPVLLLVCAPHPCAVEAREFDSALLAGGSGPSYSAQHPEWRNKYVHLTMRRGRKIAKVAMARKRASLGWYGTYFYESEMALISEWMQQWKKST